MSSSLRTLVAVRRLLSWTLFALAVFVSAPFAWGQGVLVVVNHPHPWPLPRPIPVPSPPVSSYKIKEIDVAARIRDQVGEVQVSQTFVNTGSVQVEAQFVFPLPHDAAIDRLTFLVDGKEYDGKLMKAAEARRIYEGYVRQNKDPALLEWVGWGMFQTSVFPIPAGAERKVTLKYSSLLKKNGGLTDFLHPLAMAKYTSQPIEKLAIRVNIESNAEIKSVYSPTHTVDIKRPDSQHAIVSVEQTNVIPTSDFRLMYDAVTGPLNASVISYRPDAGDDGYFLMLASPNIKTESATRPAKTVIIVLDRSGSMSGKKIEQAREACKFVVNNLREGDTFNIVAYDSSVESFKPELQKYDDATRKLALGFIEGIYPGGSTNISGALDTALNMIQDPSRPSFVLFLTDGLPTAGETNESKIVAGARAKNQHKARIVNFGVGYDVNSRLLDRIAVENSGQTEYVRPNEDIEGSVSRLYAKMSAPAMTDISISFDVEGTVTEQGAPVNRVYPKAVRDLFLGEQLVIVGRYKRPGAAKVVIKGKLAGENKSFDFPATLIEKSGDQTNGFVEKLWAIRRIGQIIEDIDLQGKNDELVNELVALSTKHGILTPYTSFLADDINAPRLASTRDNLQRARRSLDALNEAEGRSGVAQRSEKFNFKKSENAEGQLAGGRPGGLGGFGGAPAAGASAAGEAAGPSSGPALAPTAEAAAGKRLYARASNATYREAKDDKAYIATNVQQIGQIGLYLRNKVWYAANALDVDDEKETKEITKVARFSDEYFKLCDDNTEDENAVFASQVEGESLIIRLRGKIYRID